uniref:Uncharacterized protein n=1 Tax=Avena sativa TaxID=4498 RepID=A0ACD5TN48_AVESA
MGTSFSSATTDHIAVYNPLTRALHLFPIPPDEMRENTCVEYHVLSPEEDKGPLRVISVCHKNSGAQAAVLTSETRKWQIFPWVDAASMEPALQPRDEKYSSDNGKLVNGLIYWIEARQTSARVLNTTTLQFSRIDLLPHIQGQGAFTAGETRAGKLCIVCTVKLTLFVWFWRADEDGIERWMLHKTFPLLWAIYELTYCSFDLHKLQILTIVNGFVYLSIYHEPDHDVWFLSFCLETEKLDKLCPILHPDRLCPYIMAWPPSLVLNKPSSSS